MNSGMPSVLATIRSTSSAGSALPPVIRAISAAAWRWLSRLRVTAITLAWPKLIGAPSGRRVISTSTGASRVPSTIRSSSSLDVGSIQCTSSNTTSSGWRAARARSR